MRKGVSLNEVEFVWIQVTDVQLADVRNGS